MNTITFKKELSFTYSKFKDKKDFFIYQEKRNLIKQYKKAKNFILLGYFENASL
ncbi:MAG: hypothetical protein PHS49_02055 [Candidatus Gracilibacteria bacterium]|nr:hypothetical protein [Candidatus Gracilibacteria bacterium]